MTNAASYPSLDPRRGVLVVDGYGIRIAVERGHLVVSDGAGRERRERRLAKVGHGVRRLVVIGHTGTISLEALRWLDRVGIRFAHFDSDLTLLTVSSNEAVGNARLRRAQVLAYDTDARRAIVLFLLDAKLAGQARNVRERLSVPQVGLRIDSCRTRLASSDDIAEARELESSAALDYFGAWREAVVLRWINRDRHQIPDHWRAFSGRKSQIARSTNARATDPINAMLNYLYALAEVECRRACLVLGLDPGLGFLHHDTQSRHSLALDLIEAIRPDIDDYLLDLCQRRLFSASEFTETADGQCRLNPPLTHELATTLPRWETSVAPFAEFVAHVVADASPYTIRKTKPLTGAVRSSTARRSQAARRKPKPIASRNDRGSSPLLRQCVDCGTRLRPSAAMYCPSCLPGHKAEWQRSAVKAASERLDDPDLRRLQSQAVSNGRIAALERQMVELGFTPEDWNRLAPRVARLTLRQIQDATGLAISHSSRIRSGKCRPHPRHWAALKIASDGLS